MPVSTTGSPGALLRAVIDSSRRLDELSTARVIEQAAELVHKQQKSGAAIGNITPDAVFVGSAGVELRTGAIPSVSNGYAAPETTAGKAGDRRSDVYSLGALLWEALAHEKLTLGKFTPPSELNANVPSELDAICKKALALDPGDRYPSAKVMAAEIATVLEDAGYPDDSSQIAAYMKDAFPPETAGSALAAKLAAAPASSNAGKSGKSGKSGKKELAQTMMGVKASDLGITREMLSKARSAEAPTAETLTPAAAPAPSTPSVAVPKFDEAHPSATQAMMAARPLPSAADAKLVAEPLKFLEPAKPAEPTKLTAEPPKVTVEPAKLPEPATAAPQNLHQTLPFGSNAVSATDLAAAVATLNPKPGAQPTTPSPDPDAQVPTTLFNKIDTADLTIKEIPKVDPPIVAAVEAKKVDEDKPTEKKVSIASAETVATPVVPTAPADDKATNKLAATDDEATNKVAATEEKPTDKLTATIVDKQPATLLDEKQLDAPAPAATIAGLPAMPPGAGDAPIPKLNDDDFATGTGKKYPDGPPEMPAPLKPTDPKPTDLAAKSSTATAASTATQAADPTSAVSLPFRARRDSQGDMMFEKWAASTGEHSALDDGHEDDIVEEQRKQKKRLIIGVGGSLAVILLVAIIALAFGGKKTPPKKEDASAENGPSRTAPEPSTKATDSPPAPTQQPAGVGSDNGSAGSGSDQGSAGSAAAGSGSAGSAAAADVGSGSAQVAVGSDQGSAQTAGSGQGSADQAAAAAAAQRAADEAAAQKKAADDAAAKQAESDRIAKEKADADAAKQTEAERLAQEKKDAAAQAAADKQAKADAAKQAKADAKAKADADKAAKAEADKLAAADKKAKADADKQAKADAKAKADADKALQAKTEPKKTEPKKTEPKKTEPKKAEPKKVAKAEPIDPYAEPKKTPAGGGDPAGQYKLGFQQFVHGDSAGALQTFRDSLAASPGYPPTYRGLGLVYEKMGQKGQAKRAFSRYLQLSPDAPDADQIRERMQRL
jgi:hypothetical protein